MSTPATCPACGRPNAPHRVTCLYCGAAMPNPVAPPPKAAPKVENLDALVREALRGGSIDKVRQALQGAATDQPPAALPARPTAAPSGPAARPTAAPAARSAPPPPAARPAVVPSAPPPAVVRPAPPPPSAAPSDPERLDALLASARAALSAARPAEARAALHALADAARSLADALPVPSPPFPSPPPVEPEPLDEDALDPVTDPGAEIPRTPLPPIRFAHALLLDGLGDAERGGELAAALQVDAVTARAVALPRHPTVALRGDDPEALERRAERVRALGVRARVVARAELGALPAAAPVLAADRDGRWHLGEGEPWLSEDDLLASDPTAWRAFPATPLDVRLVVVGEVELRASREAAAGSRWLRPRLGADPGGTTRRRLVVDLHHDHGVARVVEGMTDLRWVAGELPTRPALKLLVDDAERRWPGARVEARRVCAAAHTHLTARGRVVSGWPTWEEHSRLCRLLRLGG